MSKTAIASAIFVAAAYGVSAGRAAAEPSPATDHYMIVGMAPPNDVYWVDLDTHQKAGAQARITSVAVYGEPHTAHGATFTRARLTWIFNCDDRSHSTGEEREFAADGAPVLSVHAFVKSNTPAEAGSMAATMHDYACQDDLKPAPGAAVVVGEQAAWDYQP